MSPTATFRFEITYTASTARDLALGSLSRCDRGEMFMADLTAIGVNLPQFDALEKKGSAISFRYKPTHRTESQHKRYLAVAANQNIDLRVLNAKTKRSIGLITYDPIKNEDRLAWKTSTSISAPWEENSKKREHSDLQEVGEQQPAPESPHKRLRLTLVPQESKQGGILEESAETFIKGHPSPLPSAKIPEPSEALLSTLEPKDLSEKTPHDSTLLSPPELPSTSKFSISLTSKITKAPLAGTGINALRAYSKSKEVVRLTRELLDVRKESAAFAARELNIIEQLQKVGVRASPATTSTSAPAANSNPSTEELLELKRRLQDSENKVEEEQRRRELAERCLDDVQRECKNPFIVPSLLEAFIRLSEMAHVASEAVSSSTAP